MTSDNLFLKLVLHFSLKRSNLAPAFNPRPECIVVPPIFTADIPVGPNNQINGLPRDLLTQNAMIEHDKLSLLNVIFLPHHHLIEICGWVQR